MFKKELADVSRQTAFFLAAVLVQGAHRKKNRAPAHAAAQGAPGRPDPAHTPETQP